MADIALSSKTATTVIVGGYIYIIIPDAGSPTGYVGRRIAVTNLLSSIQSDVDDNAFDIVSIDNRVTLLEQINKRVTFHDKTTAFAYFQPANSTITKIVARGTNNAETLLVGTTVGGNELADFTFQTAYNLRATKVKDYDSRATRTLHFTPSGTIDIDIYYTLDTV